MRISQYRRNHNSIHIQWFVIESINWYALGNVKLITIQRATVNMNYFFQWNLFFIVITIIFIELLQNMFIVYTAWSLDWTLRFWLIGFSFSLSLSRPLPLFTNLFRNFQRIDHTKRSKINEWTSHLIYIDMFICILLFLIDNTR